MGKGINWFGEYGSYIGSYQWPYLGCTDDHTPGSSQHWTTNGGIGRQAQVTASN